MDELFGGLLGAAEIVVVVLMGQSSRHQRALAKIAELERELGMDNDPPGGSLSCSVESR